MQAKPLFIPLLDWHSTRFSFLLTGSPSSIFRFPSTGKQQRREQQNVDEFYLICPFKSSYFKVRHCF